MCFCCWLLKFFKAASSTGMATPVSGQRPPQQACQGGKVCGVPHWPCSANGAPFDFCSLHILCLGLVFWLCLFLGCWFVLRLDCLFFSWLHFPPNKVVLEEILLSWLSMLEEELRQGCYKFQFWCWKMVHFWRSARWRDRQRTVRSPATKSLGEETNSGVVFQMLHLCSIPVMFFFVRC